MKIRKRLCIVAAMGVLATLSIAAWMRDDEFSPEFLAVLADAAPRGGYKVAAVRTSPDLAAPVRLEADGQPIDIGRLSSIAHAGPWVADVDGDGDRDLLVGDFPGYFWLFENQGTELKPVYTSKGKLQAGGEDAKTPVY